ncbi:MAG: hypothetical protein EBT24_11925 [Betaproteobacteria bacterium]|nr:hypothetical protein [Betaproteobacteria bacterium]
MIRPTLYLDFDGVLHPGHAQPNERFGLQNVLVDAISGYELDIVVSSSWRFHYTLAKLKSVLHAEIGRRITGITGDPVVGAHSRWREIERHALFNRVRNFRALDDSGYLFPPDCGALILCDGARGMQAAQGNELRRWLLAQP